MLLPNWVVGVLLACVASVLSNLGLNLQKLNHLNNDRSAAAGAASACPLPASGSSSSSSSSSSPSAAPPSPYFPPFTIPQSPSRFHRSFPSSRSYRLQVLPSSYQSTAGPAVSAVLGLSSTAAACSPSLPLLPSASPRSPRSPSSSTAAVSYHRQALWRFGLSLVVLGSLSDFIALMFAAQSIIAPLGSLTLVWNTLLAPCLLHEQVTRSDLIATAAIVMGSSLSVACADHRDRLYSPHELFELFARLRFVLYALSVSGGMLGLYLLIRGLDDGQQAGSRSLRFHRRQRFCYAALAGLLGGQSVLLAKCVGALLVSSMAGQSLLLLHYQSYAIGLLLALTVASQLHFLNEGLRLFTSSYIIPVYQSFWILSSVSSGMIFFGEWKGVFDQLGSGLGFPLGVAVTVAGVCALSQRGAAPDDTDGSAAGGGDDDDEYEEMQEGGGGLADSKTKGEADGEAERERRERERERERRPTERVQVGAAAALQSSLQLHRAASQPLPAEQLVCFPSASSSAFFLLNVDARSSGRSNGLRGALHCRAAEDELQTAPVQLRDSEQQQQQQRCPLSHSLPSPSRLTH